MLLLGVLPALAICNPMMMQPRLFVSGGGGGEDTSTTLLYVPFETFNTGGQDCRYEFDFRRDYDTTGEDVGAGNEWDCEDLPNGGDQGSGDGAAHVIYRAGRAQYNMGWNTGVTGGSWSTGDHVWLGYRIRWDDNQTLPPADVSGETGDSDLGGKNKFFIFGSGGSPQSRVIVYTWPAVVNDDAGCMLDGKDFSNNFHSWTRPSEFGLSLTNNLFHEDASYRQYWSQFPMIGVDGEGACGKPVVMHAANHSAVAPGPGAAVPVNGWVTLLVKATSGNPGTFEVWANNCDPEDPTSTQSVSELGVGGWASYDHNVGAYPDVAANEDIGVRIDDVLIARGGFPITWCEGGVPPDAP